MSKLGWIDFSPDDRSKVKNVLAMLSEPGTLDELGIGQVRDAFSDLLFPGISTIQTRAKYFITVPRILHDYQTLKPAKKKSLQKYLIEQENKVAEMLDVVHEEKEIGIIGRTRIKNGGVDRRPSEIYWTGLRTFGLVKYRGSLGDFCRKLDSKDDYGDVIDTKLDEGNDDFDSLKSRKLISIPPDQYGWMGEGKLSLQLSCSEAEFLKGKIVETPAIGQTVPAQIFKHGLIEKALVENKENNIDSFDQLVETLTLHDEVDSDCKKHLKSAREFSLAMEGPHIRYNVILAEINNHSDSVERYKKYYDEWFNKVKSEDLFKQGCADEWLSVAFNDGQRTINPTSRTFIKSCCDALQNDGNIGELDILVKQRAEDNKGQRSLLKCKVKDQWMGIRRLDYRWGTAKFIIQDIKDGLIDAKT